MERDWTPADRADEIDGQRERAGKGPLAASPAPKPRKRANVAAARGNFRMILRMSKDIDWDSDFISVDEIARLARAGLADLGEPGDWWKTKP